MICKRRSARTTFTILPIVLLTALLAACGNGSTTTASTPTATPTACITVTTGTIQSVNNNTLLVSTLQGKSVQATFTHATTFLRQATLTPSGLKDGSLVTVVVKQNPDNSYSALTVNVRTSLTRQGAFTNGTKLCNGQRQRGTGGFGFGNGTPGAGSGQNGQSRQTINGTVSQISASALTVTDTTGNDFTITFNSTTRISEQQTASASDLQAGEAVMITGNANSQGVINASSVSILQALPARRGTPTPTPRIISGEA